MKNHTRTCSLIVIFSIFLALFGCENDNSNKVFISPSEALQSVTSSDGSVCITNVNNKYYNVILDFNVESSHYQIGKNYGEMIRKISPEAEAEADSYVSYLINNTADRIGPPVSAELIYSFVIDRAKFIIENIPQEYRDEIEGVASSFSGGTTDKLDDGRLSINETYALNLIADVSRLAQCSAVSVFGSMSADNGNTMIGRNLGWEEHWTIAKNMAVTTIKNGDKSIVTMGPLGSLAAATGFNKNGIFVALLDSFTNVPYPNPLLEKEAYENFFKTRRSYSMDLRKALENETTLQAIADYLTDENKEYTFNHLVFLSDAHRSKVLENNFSGEGSNMRRALRSYDSELNANINWDFDDAIAAVNSFMLKGNHDNHTPYLQNTKRWESIINLLSDASKDNAVTFDELKGILSYDGGDGPGLQSDGDIYDVHTQQLIMFKPKTLHLEIFFRPKNNILPHEPEFENIPISFD